MPVSNSIPSVNYDSWFHQWFDSEHYHSLYQNRDDSEAMQFIDHLVKKLQPAPNSRMLDLACGKGRHAKMLSLRGYYVNGVDLSASSIKAAERFSSTNLSFYRHDMRYPFRIGYFDYVFNFFTSFGYFREEAENNMVIKAIADSLKPGGTVVIDYLNVAYAESKHDFNNSREIDGIKYHITKWHDQKRFYKRIKIEEGSSKEHQVFLETVAKYRLSDFISFFARNRLILKEVYGDYRMNPYSEKSSPRLILQAQKLPVT
jgi:SAM-dependent methyltransferase